MARDWVTVPIDGKLTGNVDETSISDGLAELENGFVTEQGTHSRFPRLQIFARLHDQGRAYLHDWRGDLVAATSNGRFYRVSRDATVHDKTKVAIQGGRRVVFAKTEDELVMAAGAQIIRYGGDRTELLDESGVAPLSTHVGYIDGYIVALEINSGRFYHSDAGLARVWNTLSLFAANGSPDNITGLIVTPYRELILAGPKSTEQFERLAGGTLPFFRRWSIGEGLYHPHMMSFANNGVYLINHLLEFVRFTGQQSKSAGDAMGKVFEKIDNWTDAWLGGFPDMPLHIRGQKFLVLQFPRATNRYGTKGVTFLFDYRQDRFSRLYGWHDGLGVPQRYPVWSHWTLWGRHFFGGEGVIYEVV